MVRPYDLDKLYEEIKDVTTFNLRGRIWQSLLNSREIRTLGQLHGQLHWRINELES